MLDPTPLAPGQAYATAADIRDCADLPELPVTPGVRLADGSFAPFWTRPDGTALTILVRAPSFTERREINQAAKDSDDQFALETAARCIKAPQLSREQISILAAKHPAAIDQISETIFNIRS